MIKTIKIIKTIILLVGVLKIGFFISDFLTNHLDKSLALITACFFVCFFTMVVLYEEIDKP